MIESPSGRTLEKAPRWDLTGTKGCGGGKVVSWLPLMFLGYKSIYMQKSTSEELRGAHVGGGAPTPLGMPSYLVEASRSSRLLLQVSWFAFGPRKIVMKVSFHLDSVWYSFSAKH